MRLDCPHIQDHEALGYLPLGMSTQPGGGPLLRPRRELLALGARAREEVHVAGRTGRVVGGPPSRSRRRPPGPTALLPSEAPPSRSVVTGPAVPSPLPAPSGLDLGRDKRGVRLRPVGLERWMRSPGDS